MLTKKNNNLGSISNGIFYLYLNCNNNLCYFFLISDDRVEAEDNIAAITEQEIESDEFKYKNTTPKN